MLLFLLPFLADARQFDVPSYVCDSLIDEPQLAFETELRDATVNRGEGVTLKCSVYGAPQAAITWFHRGRRVESFPTAGLELALPGKLIGSGLVESTLKVPCVDTKSAGDYVCVASTPCGHSITSEATVRIAKGLKGHSCQVKKNEGAPYISLSTVQRMELAGNPVQLMCRASGEPQPSIKWFRVNEEDQLEDISKQHSYMTLSNGDLLVVGQDPEIVSESFRCVAKNEHGQAEADSTVIFMEE